MTATAAGHRPLRRAACATTVSVVALTTALVGSAAAGTSRAATSTDNGVRALRAAAVAAAATAPGGVDRAAYRAAVEAYIWGYPLVVMARTRGVLVCGAPVNSFIHQPSLAGPTSRLVVTPNTDTLYSSAWLDLRAGPVVLRVPALTDRYYVFQLLDMYTNTITNVGTRTTGDGPATFAIVGPGWRGRLPVGTRRIDAPTPDVWIIGRTLPRDAGDVPSVVALQREYSLTPLNPTGSTPDQSRGSCGRPGPRVNAPGAQFFDELGAAMAVDPPPRGDTPILRDFAAGGIGPGRAPSKNASPAVVAALSQSIAAADAVIARSTAHNLTPVSGWSRLQHVGIYGRDYLTRAAVAQTGLGANVPAESVYYFAGADGRGVPLAGTRPEVLRFAAGGLPPVDQHGFWSVTLYGPDHFLVANARGRYAIGDRTPGLQRGPDGSLDLYLGAQAPAGHDANWLPAPVASFSLVLRAYVPGAAIRRGTWRPPTIRSLAS